MKESFPSSIEHNYTLEQQESGLILVNSRQNHIKEIDNEIEQTQPAEEAQIEASIEKTSNHYQEHTKMIGDTPLIIVESARKAVSIAHESVTTESKAASSASESKTLEQPKVTIIRDTPEKKVFKTPAKKALSEEVKQSEQSFFAEIKQRTLRKQKEKEAREDRQRELEKKAEEEKSKAILKQFDAALEAPNQKTAVAQPEQKPAATKVEKDSVPVEQTASAAATNKRSTLMQLRAWTKLSKAERKHLKKTSLENAREYAEKRNEAISKSIEQDTRTRKERRADRKQNEREILKANKLRRQQYREDMKAYKKGQDGESTIIKENLEDIPPAIQKMGTIVAAETVERPVVKAPEQSIQQTVVMNQQNIIDWQAVAEEERAKTTA